MRPFVGFYYRFQIIISLLGAIVDNLSVFEFKPKFIDYLPVSAKRQCGDNPTVDRRSIGTRKDFFGRQISRKIHAVLFSLFRPAAKYIPVRHPHRNVCSDRIFISKRSYLSRIQNATSFGNLTLMFIPCRYRIFGIKSDSFSYILPLFFYCRRNRKRREHLFRPRFIRVCQYTPAQLIGTRIIPEPL